MKLAAPNLAFGPASKLYRQCALDATLEGGPPKEGRRKRAAEGGPPKEGRRRRAAEGGPPKEGRRRRAAEGGPPKEGRRQPRVVVVGSGQTLWSFYHSVVLYQ